MTRPDASHDYGMRVTFGLPLEAAQAR